MSFSQWKEPWWASSVSSQLQWKMVMKLYKVRMKFCHFLWIMQSQRDHPRHVIKLTNTRYSFSELRYPDYVSWFQQTAGWTPLMKVFLVEGIFFTLSFFLNPLLADLPGHDQCCHLFAFKIYLYICLPFHWVVKDFSPPGLNEDLVEKTFFWL